MAKKNLKKNRGKKKYIEFWLTRTHPPFSADPQPSPMRSWRCFQRCRWQTWWWERWVEKADATRLTKALVRSARGEMEDLGCCVYSASDSTRPTLKLKKYRIQFHWGFQKRLWYRWPGLVTASHWTMYWRHPLSLSTWRLPWRSCSSENNRNLIIEYEERGVALIGYLLAFRFNIVAAATEDINRKLMWVENEFLTAAPSS